MRQFHHNRTSLNLHLLLILNTMRFTAAATKFTTESNGNKYCQISLQDMSGQSFLRL